NLDQRALEQPAAAAAGDRAPRRRMAVGPGGARYPDGAGLARSRHPGRDPDAARPQEEAAHRLRARVEALPAQIASRVSGKPAEMDMWPSPLTRIPSLRSESDPGSSPGHALSPQAGRGELAALVCVHSTGKLQ